MPGIAAPTAYDITLEVDPRLPTFKGEVVIHLDLKTPSSTINFHAVDLTLGAVTAEAGGKRLLGEVAEASGEGSEPESGEKIAVFPEILPKGAARLGFTFEGPFNQRLSGLYRAKDEGGRWYAYTQFETADARRTFPCMDEPRFKVPFRLTLIVPEGMSAFAGTPEASRETRDQRTVHRFRESRPLPTYLLAFVVGDVDVVEGPKTRTPLRGLAAKGKGTMLAEALRMHAAILGVLEDYFGRPYPYEKLDVSAQIEFSAGAMENAALITYREELLLADPATTPESRLRTIGSVAAHEMAHMWFGDLVTMEWWDDVWLNESFATWMGARAVDTWRPEIEERKDLLSSRAQAFQSDALAAARAVRQPVRRLVDAETSFDALTYTKGANILTMLEQWLGEEAFREGIRRYLDDHAWRNATAEDLFTALQAASGKDVRGIAKSFLDRPGVPLIALDLECPDGGEPAATLTQSRYRPLGSAAPAGLPEGGPWKIPVCLAYPAGETVARTCFLLSREGERRPLEGAKGCPAWIHPNAGEYGYYRWAAPAQAVRALGAATRLPWAAAPGGDAAWGKSAAERSRLALLDQTAAMVAAGRAEPGAWLDLMEEMARGADRPLLEEIVGGIDRIADVWEDLAGEDSFRSFVQRVLGAEADRLGWEPKPEESEEDTLMRPRILAALGRRARAPWVIEGAAARAKAYLDDSSSVPPELASISLALAARQGNVSFETLAGRLALARTPQERTNALGALGSLPSGKPLEAALGLVLTDAVRAQDTFRVVSTALDEPASRTQTFAFIKTHFDDLMARMPSFVRPLAPRLAGSFCTKAERDEAREFFEAKAIEGGERALAQGLEGADQCIALRAFGREALATYLLRPAPASGGGWVGPGRSFIARLAPPAPLTRAFRDSSPGRAAARPAPRGCG